MTTVDYCATPVQHAPQGQISNLVNPDDLSVAIMTSAIILTSVALVFLAGRIFINWNKLALADYLTILGFLLSAGFAAIITILRKYSRHMWDTPLCWYLSEDSWKLTFAANMLSAAAQLTVKVAILVLYFQIFSVKRGMRYAIIGTIAFGTVSLLPHPILVIAFEAPRAGQSWSQPAIDGSAAKMEYYGPVRTVASTILDICILVLPFQVLRTLNVSKRKKLQLSAVFVTGAFGVASSIVSCYWNFLLLINKPGDQSRYEYQIFIWLMVEEMIGVTVGCMPAFAAFLRIYMPGCRRALVDKMTAYGYRRPSTFQASLAVQPKNFNHSDKQKGSRPSDYYYELGDSVMITQASVTAMNPDPTSFPISYQPGSILKTREITQEFHPYPLDSIV